MWKFGFSAVSILPPDASSGRYFMSGYGENKRATGVFDPLFVRTAVLSCGGFTASFSAFDLTGMTRDDITEIAAAISSALPGRIDSANLSFTHSHAAIDTTGIWGDAERGVSGRFPDYIAFVTEKAVESAREALEDMREGELSWGHTVIHGGARDGRPPDVEDRRLTKLFFSPSDGSAPTTVVHYTCHPELLGGANKSISCDYPGELIRVVSEGSGGRAMFINGAVGGMQTGSQYYHGDGTPMDKFDNMQHLGRLLGQAALSTSTLPCPERLSVARREVDIPLHNAKFVLAGQLGLMRQHLLPGSSPTGFMLRTEIGLARIGDIYAVLMPGELFPELELGGFLHDADCSNPGVPVEPTVRDIVGRERYSVIFGLTNDEIGYIMPANDFCVHPEKPYFAKGTDRFGVSHYEETNSVGPETAGRLASALAALVSGQN